MKALKWIVMFLLFSAFNQETSSQNLDSLLQQQRDSILIEVAKEVVLKYGPGYYREYKRPVITRSQVPPLGEINLTGDDANRIFYEMVFLYDKSKEQLSYDFAARVLIWSDSRKPIDVMFGNGLGRVIPEVNQRSTKEDIDQVPYQQADEWMRKYIKASPNKYEK